MADNINNANVNTNLPLQQPPSQQAIWDYFQPTMNQNYSGIARQLINANNFELEPAFISIVQQNQFGGTMFLEICDTIKMNRVPNDVIRLHLFSFSIQDKASLWLQSFAPCSISSWNDLTQKFLTKYFPSSKTLQLKRKIAQFSWERFKDFLRRCPQHGYENWQQVQYFYNDAAAGGTLVSKIANEAHILLEEIATNSYQWPSERSSIKKIISVLEVDSFTQLAAHVSALSNQIAAWTSNGVSQAMDSMASTSTSFKETKDNEQVNFVNNHNFNFRGNQLPTHYHPGLRNHENFSYANNQNVLQPPLARLNKDETKIDNIETQLGQLASSLGAQMKSMETQIGQFATKINAQKHKRNFPSDTEINPMEHCKIIQLRSGTEIKGLEMKSSKVDEPMSSTSSESPMEEQPNEEEMQSNEQTGAEKQKSTPNFETSKFNVLIPFL
ncbi:hypothetical protein Pfo_011543 [Paulownia fortunei]|nr:hypothetical protein Pfo_011543 [Paulownia fortunei]